MQKQVIDLNKEFRATKGMPEIQAGDVVKVHLKIKEGDKQRIQMFEGLVIAVKGGQSSSPTITVRKISNGIGVEMIVPVLSQNVEKIELVKRAKVRRAKLYYVRGLTSKQSRMKYKDLAEFAPKEKREASFAEATEGQASSAKATEGQGSSESKVEGVKEEQPTSKEEKKEEVKKRRD